MTEKDIIFKREKTRYIFRITNQVHSLKYQRITDKYISTNIQKKRLTIININNATKIRFSFSSFPFCESITFEALVVPFCSCIISSHS